MGEFKRHNPVLTQEAGDDIKAALFGAVRPDPERVKAMKQIHIKSQEKEQHEDRD